MQVSGGSAATRYTFRKAVVTSTPDRVSVESSGELILDVPWLSVAEVDYTRPRIFRRGAIVLRVRDRGPVSVPLIRRDLKAADPALRALRDQWAATSPKTRSAEAAPKPSPAPMRATRPSAAPIRQDRPRPNSAKNSGDLLVLPTRGERYRVNRWAVVDLETSGLSPKQGARIVEVSIVTVENGRITDSWSTLINPGRGKTTGPAHIHRITDSMVADAPHLRDVAADIEERLSGAALVAHNAPFEGAFLDKGFTGIGRPLPQLPALDTLQLARYANLPTPNLRLATLADWAGIQLDNAHTALGDATATAQLLPVLIDAARLVEPSWRVPAMRAEGRGGGRILPRPAGDPFAAEIAGYELAEGLRKGSEGWIANLLARMPSLPAEGNPDTEQYLELVTTALADGKIVGCEARELAILAGSIGLSADQAHDLHMQVLDSMAEVALADGILTAQEHRLLTRAAESMNAAGRFDHLAARIDTDASAGQSSGAAQRRCGNCGETGHNRRTCPAVAVGTESANVTVQAIPSPHKDDDGGEWLQTMSADLREQAERMFALSETPYPEVGRIVRAAGNTFLKAEDLLIRGHREEALGAVQEANRLVRLATTTAETAAAERV